MVPVSDARAGRERVVGTTPASAVEMPFANRTWEAQLYRKVGGRALVILPHAWLRAILDSGVAGARQFGGRASGSFSVIDNAGLNNSGTSRQLDVVNLELEFP
jgi:hypothetical protein